MIKAHSVLDLYQDPELYSTSDMFSPPSERRPHVIRFELTQGCNYGQCTYCNGYDGVSYKIKSLEEYIAHVDTIFERMDSNLVYQLQRCFIGGGDALAVETSILDQAIKYTRDTFLDKTGHFPRRIAVYARTHSILKQGRSGLDKLSINGNLGGGLHLVYWGVESGSDEVLSYVHKGCTKSQQIEAGKLLQKSGLKASIMIMPGLGGMKYYESQVKETAEILGHINPKYITFMGINPPKKSRYQHRMDEEIAAGINRPLTDKEQIQQMADIIKAMPSLFINTKMGCYDLSIDRVGHNPFIFGSQHVYNRYSLDYLVSRIEEGVKEMEKIDVARKGRSFVQENYKLNHSRKVLYEWGFRLSTVLATVGLLDLSIGIILLIGEKMNQSLDYGYGIPMLIGGALATLTGTTIGPLSDYKIPQYAKQERYFKNILTSSKYTAALDSQE